MTWRAPERWRRPAARRDECASTWNLPCWPDESWLNGLALLTDCICGDDHAREPRTARRKKSHGARAFFPSTSPRRMRARCLKTARAPCPSSRRCASRRAATMGPFGAATQFLHAHVVSRLLSRLPGAEREDDEKALSEDVRVGNRPGCDDPLEPKTPGRTPSTDERGGARSGASAGETSPEPSASASPPASPWRRRFAPCASPKRRGDA